jgi:hypothetical protein
MLLLLDMSILPGLSILSLILPLLSLLSLSLSLSLPQKGAVYLENAFSLGQYLYQQGKNGSWWKNT